MASIGKALTDHEFVGLVRLPTKLIPLSAVFLQYIHIKNCRNAPDTSVAVGTGNWNPDSLHSRMASVSEAADRCLFNQG
jgi:hypothetical protein